MCGNGDAPAGSFSNGLSYCCPVGMCLAHGQSSNTGPTPGQTVPLCLDGSAATVELCRRENDNLLPTIQVSVCVGSCVPLLGCMLGCAPAHLARHSTVRQPDNMRLPLLHPACVCSSSLPSPFSS